MHSTITYLAIALPVAFAAPQVFVPDLSNYYCPQVDSAEEVTGEPWQTGLAGKGGATLTITESHEIGTTWTKGVEIGVSVENIIGVGGTMTSQVSKSVSDSTAEGAEYECPEGEWTCSLMVYPGMKRVRGHMRDDEGKGCPVPMGKKGGDFELLIPMVSQAGNKRSNVQLCTCKNLEHWADDGHPGLLCKDDCVKNTS